MLHKVKHFFFRNNNYCVLTNKTFKYMLRIFRKFRKANFSRKKIVNYLFYSIGEIALTVLGILIAIWLNKSSINKKDQQLYLSYKQSIIEELYFEEYTLNNLDSSLFEEEKRILNYFEYLNCPEVVYQDLFEAYFALEFNLGIIKVQFVNFQDIISTGNLKLFSPNERRMIIFLNTYIDVYNNNLIANTDHLSLASDRFFEKIDMAYHLGYLNSEHISVNAWMWDLGSQEYFLLNNFLTIKLEYIREQHLQTSIALEEIKWFLEQLEGN